MESSPLFGALLLLYPLKFCIVMICVTYVLSLVSRNVSQVDRLWTFLPTYYTAYFALLPLWPRLDRGSYLYWIVPIVPPVASEPNIESFSPRALLMFFLTLLWTCRLSYNTWRRGLFSLTEEDYRWAVLRKKLHWTLFQLVNIVFIAGIQNVLLLILALPAFRAARQGPTPLHLSDYILAIVELALLAWEFTADNQQYAYHAWKHGKYDPKEHWLGARLVWTESDRQRGFITRGLWAWSRHPNFFAEQSFWCIITLFPLIVPEASDNGLARPGSVLEYIRMIIRLLPAMSLCALFLASTRFTESISAGKYPAYAAYQRRVSMFVPFLTPVWGAWIKLVSGQQQKDRTDALVWGLDVKEEKRE